MPDRNCRLNSGMSVQEAIAAVDTEAGDDRPDCMGSTVLICSGLNWLLRPATGSGAFAAFVPTRTDG